MNIKVTVIYTKTHTTVITIRDPAFNKHSHRTGCEDRVVHHGVPFTAWLKWEAAVSDMEPIVKNVSCFWIVTDYPSKKKKSAWFKKRKKTQNVSSEDPQLCIYFLLGSFIFSFLCYLYLLCYRSVFYNIFLLVCLY